MVRAFLAFFACAALAGAQSHPSWWTYASPGATALVGIEWESVRTSPFADAIQAELWDDLGFPALPCLQNARQIVISSPELLALASGTFSAASMHDQSAQKHFKAMTYRGVDMWFATQKGVLSVARLSEQLLLIGEPKTLQEAIDRSMDEARNYSPLLARAARFAQKELWVVASQLPDDLANRFVPLDTEAQGFEGSLSLHTGLELDAVLSAGSAAQAMASADKLRLAAPNFPAILRGLQVTVEHDSVLLALTATRAEVTSALRGPDPMPAPVEKIKVETPGHIEYVAVEKPEPPKTAQKTVEKVVEKAVEKPVEKTPEKPQIIRIVGLDDGPREIVLPPANQN